MSLTEIAPLLDLTIETDVNVPVARDLGPAWQGYLSETMSALESFSTDRLDRLYNEACALYPIDIVTEKLMLPVLEQLGLRWDKRPGGIAEEHFFSAWLRNKLGARLHHAAGLARGRQLILCCLPGEQHEVSLLLTALGVLQLGYRVIYLGADMPLAQLLPVCRQTHAAGIILAGRGLSDQARLTANLTDIAMLVRNSGVPVFVGGEYAVLMRSELRKIGAEPLGVNLALGLRAIDESLAATANAASRLRRQ
jgi:hypothetical protein